MSSFESSDINSLPPEIYPFVTMDGLIELVSALLGAYRTIGDVMRAGGYSSAQMGTENAFGDNQLDVDVKTDAVIFEGNLISQDYCEF